MMLVSPADVEAFFPDLHYNQSEAALILVYGDGGLTTQAFAFDAFDHHASVHQSSALLQYSARSEQDY